MALQLTLRAEQLKDLSVLRDLGPEALQAIVDRLSTLDPPTIRASVLHRVLNDVLPTPYEAEVVMRQLLSLYALRRQRSVDAGELLEGLLHGIRASRTPWTEDEISRWQALGPKLRELFSLSTVWTVLKALDLSYDYENLLQNVKILTDIRPIFNDEGSDIQGSIISYTLRLYFDSVGDSRTLSIALDEKDINRLLGLCERALKKGSAAKRFMDSHDIKRTFICGEDE